MATSSNGSSRGARTGSARRPSAGAASQGSSRPRRPRSGGNGSARGRGGSSYSLHKNNIRFNTRGGSVRDKVERLDRRTLLVLAAALVVVIVLVLVISSIASSCSRDETADQPVNENDARVAAGVDASTTAELTPILDRSDKYDKLAKQADRYNDASLIELAIREPDALDFVLSYPDLVGAEGSTATTTPSPYDGTAAQGVLTPLYCWNKSWGALTYNSGPMAVTGSGPCALSAAIMYLTGSTKLDPGTIAVMATQGGYAGGETGMMSSFLSDEQDSLGIEESFYEPSINNLSSLLSAGVPVLMDVSSGALGDTAHWVLVYKYNDDNSVAIFDPTSVENTERPWSIGTMANAANSFYGITANPNAATTTDSGTTSDSATDAATTAGSTTATTGTGATASAGN